MAKLQDMLNTANKVCPIYPVVIKWKQYVCFTWFITMYNIPYWFITMQYSMYTIVIFHITESIHNKMCDLPSNVIDTLKDVCADIRESKHFQDTE